MQLRLTRFFLISFLFLILLMSVSGCSTSSKEKTYNNENEYEITITTGGTTGPYFTIANGLADLIDKNMTGYKASVRSSGGGVANLKLLVRKQAELGFVMADISSFAYQGKLKGLTEDGNSLRTITSLYPNFVQVITLRSKGIQSIHDLKGKRVGVGDIGSGTEVNAKTILQAYGLNYDDLDERFLSFKDSVSELEKGNIDAAFLTSGLPNKAITELSTKGDVQFVPISKQAIALITQKYPYYFSDVIPKGTYNNVHDVPTAAITNLLLTRKDVPKEIVYAITKTLFEHLDELRKVHLAVKDIRLQDIQKGVTVPFHPGAIQYFEEQGIHVLPLQTDQK